MKIGWLIWEDEDDKYPILVDEYCAKLYYCSRKVQIVFAEVEQFTAVQLKGTP